MPWSQVQRPGPRRGATHQVRPRADQRLAPPFFSSISLRIPILAVSLDFLPRPLCPVGLPTTSSPSQWPGTARSSTSGGRSEMLTTPSISNPTMLARPSRPAPGPPRCAFSHLSLFLFFSSSSLISLLISPLFTPTTFFLLFFLFSFSSLSSLFFLFLTLILTCPSAHNHGRACRLALRRCEDPRERRGLNDPVRRPLYRTFRHDDFTAAALAEAKLGRGHVVSVCLPARDEAATIGAIVERLVGDLVEAAGLVDEVLVVDDHSTDAHAAHRGRCGRARRRRRRGAARAGSRGGQGRGAVQVRRRRGGRRHRRGATPTSSASSRTSWSASSGPC